MNPRLHPFAFALALTCAAAGPALSGTGIFDQTQALFTAPYYIYPEGELTRLSHTHLFYIGSAPAPGGGIQLEYSFGLLGTGDLDFDEGNANGLYATLERPSTAVTPPYQILGMSVSGEESEAGGLLLGGLFPSAWSGQSFGDLFPNVDMADIVTQLRSGQLAGGVMEEFITQLVLADATLKSDAPLPVPDPPEPWLLNRIPGNVLGFDPQGSPVDLAVFTDYYQYEPLWVNPEFSMYSMGFTIVPEGAASPSLLGILSLLAAGRVWRQRAG